MSVGYPRSSVTRCGAGHRQGLMGGFQGARIVHFAGMSVIVGFLVVHVLLSLLVPQTLWAMLTGGPRVGPSGHGKPAAAP